MDEERVVEALPSGPFKWAGLTDTGKDRSQNEDSFIVEPESGLFILSDGMGGHRGGKLAANIVTEDLSSMIDTRLGRLSSSSPRVIRRLLRKTIAEQNRQLHMEGGSEDGYKGMGATVVLVLLREARAYLAHLGDSRIYRLRKGRFVQQTRDHSVVTELIEAGELKPEEAENHALANEITHFVGMEEKAMAEIRSFALVRGDRLLLCSDGLTGMVDDKSIAGILRKQTDPQVACEQLVRAANDAGGHDNITVVIVDWFGRG